MIAATCMYMLLPYCNIQCVKRRSMLMLACSSAWANYVLACSTHAHAEYLWAERHSQKMMARYKLPSATVLWPSLVLRKSVENTAAAAKWGE